MSTISPTDPASSRDRASQSTYAQTEERRSRTRPNHIICVLDDPVSDKEPSGSSDPPTATGVPLDQTLTPRAIESGSQTVDALRADPPTDGESSGIIHRPDDHIPRPFERDTSTISAQASDFPTDPQRPRRPLVTQWAIQSTLRGLRLLQDREDMSSLVSPPRHDLIHAVANLTARLEDSQAVFDEGWEEAVEARRSGQWFREHPIPLEDLIVLSLAVGLQSQHEKRFERTAPGMTEQDLDSLRSRYSVALDRAARALKHQQRVAVENAWRADDWPIPNDSSHREIALQRFKILRLASMCTPAPVATALSVRLQDEIEDILSIQESVHYYWMTASSSEVKDHLRTAWLDLATFAKSMSKTNHYLSLFTGSLADEKSVEVLAKGEVSDVDFHISQLETARKLLKGHLRRVYLSSEPEYDREVEALRTALRHALRHARKSARRKPIEIGESASGPADPAIVMPTLYTDTFGEQVSM